MPDCTRSGYMPGEVIASDVVLDHVVDQQDTIDSSSSPSDVQESEVETEPAEEVGARVRHLKLATVHAVHPWSEHKTACGRVITQ
eukprot:6070229-Amphidinium_carterae.1